MIYSRDGKGKQVCFNEYKVVFIYLFLNWLLFEKYDYCSQEPHEKWFIKIVPIRCSELTFSFSNQVNPWLEVFFDVYVVPTDADVFDTTIMDKNCPVIDTFWHLIKCCYARLSQSIYLSLQFLMPKNSAAHFFNAVVALLFNLIDFLIAKRATHFGIYLDVDLFAKQMTSL